MIKFILNYEMSSYSVKSPLTRIRYEAKDNVIEVEHPRDFEYFRGRPDICYEEGTKGHEAKNSQKSFTQFTPSAERIAKNIQKEREDKLLKEQMESKPVVEEETVKEPVKVEPKKEPTKKIQKKVVKK